MPDALVIETADGRCPARIFTPSGREARRGIVFYMDGLAMRPALFDMAQRLADLGYLVLLPDLYYRDAPYAPFSPATAFSEPAEHARLMGLVGGLDNEKLRRDTQAIVGWMIASDRVSGPIGAVGYCMGARAAMLSTAASRRVTAAAAVHGAHIATERPDSPHLAVARAGAAFYAAVGGEDELFGPDEGGRLAAGLLAGKVDAEIETYKTARHGFAIDDARFYDREQAERHWRRLERFFAERLA